LVADPVVRRRIVLGYSVAHRPIVAFAAGDPDASVRVLVVGCIHGNEPAGIAIARRLQHMTPPREVDLWSVLDLNPDGVAADTRGNAHSVDLNRNFPHRWRPLGPAGTQNYAGTGPLSEPESRLMATLLRRIRPQLAIWYHQALGVVDISEGPRGLERHYAAIVGLPTRALPDYPGSAVGYENSLFGPTAFVVELRGGQISPAQVRRQSAAVLAIVPAPTS
jgi:protein MpaA